MITIQWWSITGIFITWTSRDIWRGRAAITGLWTVNCRLVLTLSEVVCIQGSYLCIRVRLWTRYVQLLRTSHIHGLLDRCCCWCDINMLLCIPSLSSITMGMWTFLNSLKHQSWSLLTDLEATFGLWDVRLLSNHNHLQNCGLFWQLWL